MSALFNYRLLVKMCISFRTNSIIALPFERLRFNKDPLLQPHRCHRAWNSCYCCHFKFNKGTIIRQPSIYRGWATKSSATHKADFLSLHVLICLLLHHLHHHHHLLLRGPALPCSSGMQIDRQKRALWRGLTTAAPLQNQTNSQVEVFNGGQANCR